VIRVYTTITAVVLNPQEAIIPPCHMASNRQRAGPRRFRTRRAKVPRNIIKFQREFIVTRGKTASDTGTYLGFSLSQFNDSDIVSLFTEYRITSLELMWVLVNAPNNNANFPTLYVAPQHISISPTAPSTRDEVIQYQGIRTHQFGPSNLVYRQTYTPWVPIDVNTVGRKFEKSPWLSVLSDTMPHYVAVDWLSRYNSAPDSSHTIELVIRAQIECRGVR
jgi:hypothetical protein